MVGKTVAAGALVLAVWGAVAWTSTHHNRPRNPVSPHWPFPVLDESRIPARPIAYPLLEAATVDASSLGLFATTEDGVLTIRGLGASTNIADVDKALRQLRSTTEPASYSVMPTFNSGAELWRGNVRNRPAAFRYVTTDTELSLYAPDGKRLWEVKSFPPQYTLTVDTHRKATLTNSEHRRLWSGNVPALPNGFTGTGDGTTYSIYVSGAKLDVTNAHQVNLTVDGRGVYSSAVLTTPVVLRLNLPGQERIFAIDDFYSPSTWVAIWEPGIDAIGAISTDQGTVTVKDGSGHLFGSKHVDLGKLSTTLRKPVERIVDGYSHFPFVTPIPPLYVDQSTVEAAYRDKRGQNVANETITYRKAAPNIPGEGVVDRHFTTCGQEQRSTFTAEYPAPSRPASTTWNW